MPPCSLTLGGFLLLMTSEEIIRGNALLAKIDGMENSPLPLMYHSDWNWIVSVYNKILKLIASSPVIQEKLKNEKNIVVSFSTRNFFHLLEGQLSISSCWLKAVDFAIFYFSNC